LSAILAGLTVSVAEHRFYGQLPPIVAERVEGARFADDGMVAIVEWFGVVESAEVLFNKFVNGCYPKPLELEVEAHGGMFKFLECTVRVGVDRGVVEHRSKVWAEWWATGSSRQRAWTGAGSWGGGTRGVLIGHLLRAWGNCTRGAEHWVTRVKVWLRVLVEAQELGGYSNREMRRVVWVMKERVEDETGEAGYIVEAMDRGGRRAGMRKVYSDFMRLCAAVQVGQSMRRRREECAGCGVAYLQ
jgi:hypothetical protein